MSKFVVLTFLVACLGPALSAFPQTRGKGVVVVAYEAHQRVDITIDGKPFTSYIWPSSLKKPVLYPLVSESGITVTRGYPLEPRPDERVDHPHHAGLWFNYGDVNGFDFWNNSDAIKPEDRSKMGTILHSGVLSTKSGLNQGELIVGSIWVTGEKKEILKQTARYVFARRQNARIIDLVVTLQALDRTVFSDDKEGLLGMRVARWLESPEEKGGVFIDAQGKPTAVDAAPTDSGSVNHATGVYLTSEGARGSSAWGTRGRWCALTGHTSNNPVTIAMFDHPGNPDYPTYWHARGYGLFAANPLGRTIFDPKQPPLNFSLQRGQSAIFRYRVVIYSSAPSATEINREADAFAAEYK
jgi:hypothetical protein